MTQGDSPSKDTAQVVAVAMLLVEKRLQEIRAKVSRRALRLIREKLEELDTKLLTMRPGKWTTNRAKAVRAILRRGMAELSGDSIRQMSRDMATVSLESRNQTVRYLQALDEEFTGSVQPISFDSLKWWEQTASDINRTRIRLYTRSWQRYGAKVTMGIEDAIAKRVLVGERWDMARDEVMAVTREQVGDKEWMVDRILRTECLLPDALVSGAVVRAATRRSYKGTVVEIITEGGRKLTTTPNHPMLTRRGWVATGKLSEGDDLVCYIGDQSACASRDQNVATPPSTIREIFDAVAAVGVCERRRGAQPDFHGDGMDGDVDIFSPAGALGFGRFAAIQEPLRKHVFTPANGMGILSFCSRCRCLLSDNGRCFCSIACSDAHLKEPAFDCTVPHTAKLSTQSAHAFTCLVPCTNLIQGQVAANFWVFEKCELPLCSIGHRPLLDATSLELSEHCSAWDVGILKNAPSAEPGDVEFDRVIELRRREYSGHVYNLATSHGYFAMNGAITGNTSAAWNGTALEAMKTEDRTSKEDDFEYDPMFKKLVATFDDVTGRDSVVLHGQTRPVDQPFYDKVNGITYMAPPNRPNDREIIVPWRESYGEEFEDYTVETADDYDPEIHGERARLQTKKPIANDPTRPSVRDRRDQLRNLRGQRSEAVDDLRNARLEINELEQKDPRQYREQLTQLVNRRKFLRGKVDEMSTWIDQIEGM